MEAIARSSPACQELFSPFLLHHDHHQDDSHQILPLAVWVCSDFAAAGIMALEFPCVAATLIARMEAYSSAWFHEITLACQWVGRNFWGKDAPHEVYVKVPQEVQAGITAAVQLGTALGLVKESTKDNELLPKRIASTLQLDYFGDAADQAEGLQIFGDLHCHPSSFL